MDGATKLEISSQKDDFRRASPSPQQKLSKGTPSVNNLSLITRYSAILKKYPVLLGSPQQALIMSIANIAKQSIHYQSLKHVEGEFILNRRSVSNAAILGGVFMAPVMHLWYLVLNKYVRNNVAKTLVDQLIMAWVFNTYAQFILASLNNELFLLNRRHVELVLIR
jgi:hypothetical protein